MKILFKEIIKLVLPNRSYRAWFLFTLTQTNHILNYWLIRLETLLALNGWRDNKSYTAYRVVILIICLANRL